MGVKNIIFTLLRLLIRPRILGRYSCLGNEVVRIVWPLNCRLSINYQKLRVDSVSRAADEDPLDEALFSRTDIADLVKKVSQENFKNDLRSSDFLIMDTFCELADREFITANKSNRFYCGALDVSIESIKQKAIIDCGLIETSELERHYYEFFRRLLEINTKIKIIMLIMPVDLESRAEFVKRGLEIEVCLFKLKNKFPINLTVIKLDKSEVKHSHINNHQYHFNDATYQSFATELKRHLNG